ncbi:MAG TPA: helix-turn-helix transcriptional regulator [Polyangiaceae bacterium]|nr:helix-turn-helix transcriptional regulator [Polyangiaceae bacterium]
MLASEPTPASVSRLVAAYWSFRGAAARHRVLPDGSIDFLFDLESGSGFVVGPMRSAQVLELPASTSLFGVRFVPGAASAFVDVEASALLDLDAPLGELTRAPEFHLAERVAEARSDAERAALVTRVLCDTSFRLRPLDARVQSAVARLATPAHGVSTVADQIGIGERQLERLFRERVGLGPKRYARIARLQRTLSLAERERSTHANLARRAGYSDESHFVREVRELAGVAPRELFP